MNFRIDCVTSENFAFGAFTDEFAIILKVQEKCDARLSSPYIADVKRMWGEAPAVVVLPKFDYKVSSECEGNDLSLLYMPEARPLGSKDKFSALPD